MSFNDNSSGYEFTPEQNTLITKLASMMRLVGVVFIVSGVLTTLFALNPINIVAIIEGSALLVIGYSLITASTSFKKIVETEGNDINNLMTALQQLYNACAIQLWLVVAVIVLEILISLFA